jgi:hypothetical protein
MPRSRELKYGFFTDEQVAALTPLARLLFQGLWCLADCDGRLEDRPARIKVQILPYDDCDIDALLQELHDADGDFVHRYEVDGRKYIQIRTLKKNQHFHPKEKSAGFPPAPAAKIPGKPGGLRTSPALPSGISKPSEPSEDCAELFSEEQLAAPPRPDPVLLTFPCAKSESWDLTESAKGELEAAFPNVDVMACARQALFWCKTHPKQVKTSGHMLGWIGTVWCSKEQNRGGTKPQQQTVRWANLE